jgi:UDP-N-acetylmuramoyl-tripeptide--D-alanyl-D-alanine ligase
MLSLMLSDIALWTRGTLRGGDVRVDGVFTDTRRPQAGALFVALKGETFDAHNFLAQAAGAGAAAALVERPVAIDLPQVVVADTMLALGDLASAVRAPRRAHVIGVTGSNGKTTVKTLLASILALHGRTHVNAGNLNNEIGLPLSLLAMPEDTDYAVLEMGAGKPGDIAYLAAIARPQIGLVNNIAPAHLERMGTLEGIAETKGALYTSLPPSGVAVINADDAFAATFAAMAGTRRIVRFGMGEGADPAEIDVRGQIIDAGAQMRFALLLPGGRCEIALPLRGRHNVMNALAAAAAAHALDVPAATIQRGLESAPPVKGRLQRHAMARGWTLIDDSYNANPGSTEAAIKTLAGEPGEGWLVLGDMRELGPSARQLHVQVGELAREHGIGRLFAVGPLAAAAVDAFGSRALHFADQQALIDTLAKEVHSGVTVLVKGSRGSAMDNVVRALLERVPGGSNGGDKRHAA